jgi:hypothetical protein
MIQATCPKCGSHSEFDETVAGQEAHCPACKEAMPVPKQTGSSRNRKRMTLLLFVLACGIVLLMVGYTYFGWGTDDSAGAPKLPTEMKPRPPSGPSATSRVS